MLSFSAAFALALLALVIRRAYKVYTAVKSFKDIPRYYVLVDPLNPLSFLLPIFSWNPGLDQAWKEWDTLYSRYNTEALLYVPLLAGHVSVHCSSPEALRMVLGDAFLFSKPEKVLALNFMGSNVVASTGEQWRRHRKIAAPAFDNQSYANVWEVTSRLYHEMVISEEWKSDDRHYFASFNQFTTRLALLVISACGFNMHLRWDESPTRKELTNPIDSTIVMVSKTVQEKVIFPNWVFRLPIEFLQRMRVAFADLETFLHNEISAKKAELKNDLHFDGSLSESNKTVFGRLVAASQQEGAKGLDDREIAGNLFIFFFAGHETTAHTLVATLAMLAIHQEEQNNVYKHIMSVLGDAEPTFEDYNSLAPVLHCFHETIRLFPAAYVMLRSPSEDTAISASKLTPSSDTVVLPKGTEIVLDIIGAARNPRIYPDPASFKPSRWNAPSALDNFLGFSSGPRVCLGRKFATVEAVCFLTWLLREWKVDVKLDAGETLGSWQQKYLKPTLGITLKTGDVPLLLTRRSA
ncbi:unnamed protein product [Somion occarium]|uniref:Cytochrome P450 n=1 Tax=Somion occarium TaxID=3059160 RepID=A0ABP1DFN9_9APHY